jgi:glycosyltransferase involved in cell wall biosynthesis
MRIGILTPYPRDPDDRTLRPDDTGVKLYAPPLAAALAAAEREVTVTVFGPRGKKNDAWFDGPVRVQPLFCKKNPFSLFSLLMGASRVDVLHVQHELYAFGGVLTALLLPVVLALVVLRGTPIVTTLHGVLAREDITPDFARRNGLRYPVSILWWAWSGIIKMIAAVSRLIHVHEPHLRETLIRDYHIAPERIVVAPLAMMHSANAEKVPLVSKAEARARLGIESDRNVALFFGFINAYKGVEELLEAAEGFLAADPTNELIIVGSVPERLASASSIAASLVAAARRPRIRVTGFAAEEDVVLYYRAADVLVLPYKESLSASGPLSKALAFETPVLISRSVARSYSDAPFVFDVTPEGIGEALTACFAGGNKETLHRYWSQVAVGRSFEAVAISLLEMYRGAVR